MSKIIRAAAVQIAPVLYSREGTVEKVVRKILELGQQGVQFATFPETVVPYYPYFSFIESPFAMGAEHYKLLDQAVTIPSDTTRAIGEAARQASMVVSIGVNERDGRTLYNTQLLFDADGTLFSGVENSRRLITSEWSGEWAMAPACARSIPLSAASVSLRAGNTTTRSRAMR